MCYFHFMIYDTYAKLLRCFVNIAKTGIINSKQHGNGSSQNRKRSNESDILSSVECWNCYALSEWHSNVSGCLWALWAYKRHGANRQFDLNQINMDDRQTKNGLNSLNFFESRNGLCMYVRLYTVAGHREKYMNQKGAGQACHKRAEWQLEENHLLDAAFSHASPRINRTASNRKC